MLLGKHVAFVIKESIVSGCIIPSLSGSMKVLMHPNIWSRETGQEIVEIIKINRRKNIIFDLFKK
jgi:hypothetical protein